MTHTSPLLRRHRTASSAVALLLSGALVAPLARPARAAEQPAPDDKGEKADKGEGEGEAAAAAEGQPQAVRVTTFLMEHPGVTDEVALAAMRAVGKGLKKNTRLEMKEMETRLADFAQEVPTDQVEEARKLLKEGQKALFNLELGKAKKTLRDAVDALSRVLPFVKKQELADAMMGLASAEWQEGDKKGAKATLARLFVWRSDYKLDPSKFPPQMIGPVEEARKEVERYKRGSLEIHSDPVPAQAYVDGRPVGVTPAFAEGLTVGEHYVTLKRDGYKKAVMPATVSAKMQQIVTVKIERSGKYLLVEQALQALAKQLGGDNLDESADNLKETLFIDHAVFVRPKDAGGGNIEVEALLYDMRTKHKLARVTTKVPSQGADKQLQEMTGELYKGVKYDAELEAPKDAPPPAVVKRRPVYKTWWFWTVAGVVVVGVALGAALAPRPKDYGDGNWGLRISF